MLDQIELNPQSLDRYAASAGPEAIARLRELALYASLLHLPAPGVARADGDARPLVRAR